jgi:hypothetical protein
MTDRTRPTDDQDAASGTPAAKQEDPRLTFAIALMNAIGEFISPAEAAANLRREWAKMRPRIIHDADRLHDLARYCRVTLLEDGLISIAEYEALTLTRESQGRALESFESIRARLARCPACASMITESTAQEQELQEPQEQNKQA